MSPSLPRETLPSSALHSCNQRLLEACDRIGRKDYSVGGTQKMQVYLVDMAKDALKTGASPTSIDGQGKDAFALLAKIGDNTSGAANTVGKLLIEHGYPILENNTINLLDGRLFEVVVDHILRKENQRTGIRSKNGESLLHVLARQGRIDAVFVATPQYDPSAQHIQNSTSKCLVDPRSDGKPPLQIVWERHEPSQHSKDNEYLWSSTMLMVKAGADLHQRDHNGVCTLDVIEQMTNSGQVALLESVSGMNQLQAAMVGVCSQIQTALLERSTQAHSGYCVSRKVRL